MHDKGMAFFYTIKIFLSKLPKIPIKSKILPTICKLDIKKENRKSL